MTEQPQAETPQSPPILREVLWPVTDLQAALSFYVGGLGMTLKFRDGDRFAAVAGADNVTLALVTGTEAVTGSAPAPAYRVGDLAAAVGRAEESGAIVITRDEEGAHEHRAVLRDPAGHLLVLYQSR
ncbi:MAG: hypothetical protein QOF92_4790 [Pseudonocardiales bacterium]|jgi:catechol 2,3-dioxygenase-like lactoylglutathione lyase family enzyme|nr:putative glyoxalase/dioxygenase [Jatrophihabitans sp.]MDT4931923.1 hypothetical protein [Pseudonocardiales bacterium]MDT4950460.1 hypothetical protein [Pseudonocardiales bacterium]